MQGPYSEKKYVVQILDVIKQEGRPISLLLMNDDGITVLFPYAIVQANKMEHLISDQFQLTASLYKTWFAPTIHELYKELSDELMNRFDKIVENSDKILMDKGFRQIQLPILRSKIVGDKSYIQYTLGGLLEAWIEASPLQLDDDLFMIKIIANKKGDNKVLAWSRKKEAIVKTSIHCKAHLYIKYFCLLAPKKLAEYPNLLDMMRLLDLLG